MIGMRLDCSWDLHGFSLEFPQNRPLECCLEFAWNLPWNGLEFCLDAPWNFLECSSGVLLGICLEFNWDLHGFSVEFAWNCPLESCLEIAWNFFWMSPGSGIHGSGKK